MASRNIKGITIEIDGSTKGLQDSLKDVNEDLKRTQDALRDVNKLLKMDPSNVDLLQQKQGLLKNAIDKTKEKLEQEKTALEQLKNADPSPENTRNMETLQRQIADDEQELKRLTEESKKFGSVFKQQCEAAGEKIKEVGDKVGEVGEAMTKNLTVPIVAAGGAAVAAFTEVDAAEDALIKKTGATGEELDSMKSIMEDIATTIPTDFETAANAVGEVSTRFGVTGDELEDLSSKFVKFAELNNSDVTTAVDNVQTAMAAWGLSAEQAGAFMDTLTAAAQDTGANAANLADIVADNKTVFDEMGFSVSDAVNWLANLEKNGVDSGSAMAGLKKGLQNATKEGVSMKAALFNMTHSLQNATSDTEAMAAVSDLFGSKAGPALAAAVEEGRISFDALGTSIEDNLGTVDKTFEATLDPTDKLKTTFNQLKSTGAEVGGTILEMLAPAFEAVSNAIKSLKEWWDGLSPTMQKTIVTVAGVIAAIGPALTMIQGIIGAVGTLSTVIGLLSGPVGLIVAGIAALVAAGIWLYNNWDWLAEGAKNVWHKVTGFFENMWNGIKNTFNAIKEGVSNAWNTMTSFMTEKTNALKDMISGKWDAIKQKYQEAGGGIKGIVSGMIEGVKQYFTLGFDALNAITGGKLNAIKDTFSTILNSAKSIVSNAISGIKNLFNFSWSLPKLKMPHFSWSMQDVGGIIKLPKISVSWYKKAYENGVMFSQPTILQTPSGLKGFGDGVGNEIVIGQNRLMSMISKAAGPVNITINTQPNQNAEQIAQAVSDILYGQYQATGY